MQPEPSTRSLLNAARRSESEQGAATDAEQGLIAELVGREREFSAIISAWERARVGTYTHLHVTAPAGMGKTRLLNDVHARLRAMRARVVHIRGNLGARDLPYALASDLAAGLAELPGARGVSTGAAGALVALNPTLSSYYSASYSASPDRSDGDEALRRRAVAVRELIVAVADENPVALLVDDVQWADSASRMLLGSVLGGLGGHRVLVVSAARPYAKAKLAGSDTIELTLAPLSLTEIGALMASLGELPDEPWVPAVPEAMHQASDGSPLLVLENLQLALDRGLLERGRKGWSSPDPGGLFDMLLTGGALRHRLQDGLAADGPLLTLLAVAGVPLATDVLARAATAELREVEDRLAALERRNLVTRAGHGE
jgi:predicted ATPase